MAYAISWLVQSLTRDETWATAVTAPNPQGTPKDIFLKHDLVTIFPFLKLSDSLFSKE